MRQATLTIVVFALLTVAASYLGAHLPGVANYDHLVIGDVSMSVGAGCG